MSKPVEPESFYIFFLPVLVISFLVLLVMFCMTQHKVRGDPRFSLILSLVIVVTWATLCLVLLFNMTGERLPNELTLLAYAGLVFLVLFALALWQYRLRYTLAIPVAALASSAWLLAAWLASARR